MIEEILAKLGLNPKETKVYLTCLRLGPAPVRKIADEADINRGTTYDILKGLREQGLVSYYHRDTHQYFTAEDPEKLKEVVSQKRQQLKSLEEQIGEIVPQLKSLADKAGDRPVVKYYEGSPAIRTILQDVLTVCQQTSEKEYCAYSSSAIKQYLYDVYPKFSDDRIKAGIKVRVLSIGSGGETRGLDERKWLSREESAPTYTLIYAGKMAIISVDGEHKPIGVIIEDSNIYQTQRIIFDSLWGTIGS